MRVPLGFSYLQRSGVCQRGKPDEGAQTNASGVFKKCLKQEEVAAR